MSGMITKGIDITCLWVTWSFAHVFSSTHSFKMYLGALGKNQGEGRRKQQRLKNSFFTRRGFLEDDFLSCKKGDGRKEWDYGQKSWIAKTVNRKNSCHETRNRNRGHKTKWSDSLKKKKGGNFFFYLLLYSTLLSCKTHHHRMFFKPKA